jgi:hypothetical protein
MNMMSTFLYTRANKSHNKGLTKYTVLGVNKIQREKFVRETLLLKRKTSRIIREYLKDLREKKSSLGVKDYYGRGLQRSPMMEGWLIRGSRSHLHFLAAQHLAAPAALQALVAQTHFLAQQGSLHPVQGLGPQHLELKHLHALVPQTHFLAQQASLHLLQGLGPQHLVPKHLQALVPQTHFLAQQASLHLLQGLGQHLAPAAALQALVPQTHFLVQQASLHLLQARLTTLRTLAGADFLAIVLAMLIVGRVICLIIL